MKDEVTNNKTTGEEGEDRASFFLIKNGFDIICRNYRFKHYEVDIIAQKNDCLHFCEVKSRKNNNFGYPETFVTVQQQERIKKAADNFVYEKQWGKNIKFDIVSIEGDNNEIRLFEDAFF